MSVLQIQQDRLNLDNIFVHTELNACLSCKTRFSPTSVFMRLIILIISKLVTSHFSLESISLVLLRRMNLTAKTNKLCEVFPSLMVPPFLGTHVHFLQMGSKAMLNL